MEHIVQFAIGIDDNAIKRRVEDNAEKVIIEQVTKDVREKIFHISRWGEISPSDPFTDFSKRIIGDFLENNREEIIDRASAVLADRLSRTKAAREAASETVRAAQGD